MFKPGGAVFTPNIKALLQIITRFVVRFPKPISISGHTDSALLPSGATYSNWELSGDRANSARRTMVSAGLPNNRIADVVGRADTEHLFPKEPNAASNWRISILLVRMVDAEKGKAAAENDRSR